MFRIYFRARNPRIPFGLLPTLGRDKPGDFLTGGSNSVVSMRRETFPHLTDPSFGLPEGFPTLPEKTTPTGTRELPPGFTPLGVGAVVPEEQPLVSRETIQGLIGDVRRPDSRVTNLKLPDGLEIGFTPEEPLPPGVGEEAKAGDFVKGEATTDIGFFDKIGQAIRDPRFGYITGRLAQAVAPESKGIQMAGGLGAELAIGRATGEFQRVLDQGGDLTDPKFQIIPSELKQQAIQAKLEGRKLNIQEQYMSALGKQAEATAAGTFTVEQKQDIESQANATRLQLGRLSNKYMNIGQGHVFDVETGNVVKAYDYQTGGGGSAVGNLNSSDYRLFNEYTTATFLPTAIENRRAEVVKTQGEEFAATVDLIGEFKNEDGSTNFQRLMKYLSEEQRVQFAGQLNEYTNNVARGISPTGTFLQQQIEANTITTPDGKKWRVLPDGSYEEIQ